MSNLVSIDGHAMVVSEEERESRLLAIRQEGAQLLNLYQSVQDKDVRAAILVLVKSMGMMCREPAPPLEHMEREALADTHLPDSPDATRLVT